MDPRIVAVAVAAGTSAFLLVGATVTENPSAAIEFSVFLGVPAGVVSGLAAAALAYRLSGGEDPGTRRMALAGGGFGGAFLLVAGLGSALGARASVTFPLATAAALAGATAAYLRARPRSRGPRVETDR